MMWIIYRLPTPAIQRSSPHPGHVTWNQTVTWFMGQHSTTKPHQWDSPLFLKNSFARYRIICQHFFLFFQHLEYYQPTTFWLLRFRMKNWLFILWMVLCISFLLLSRFFSLACYSLIIILPPLSLFCWDSHRGILFLLTVPNRSLCLYSFFFLFFFFCSSDGVGSARNSSLYLDNNCPGRISSSYFWNSGVYLKTCILQGKAWLVN
uniref:Uncharacterized protein n=1 Tax=Pipistrellus kuhlii TaxID=59472 RepID=A0A7J7SFC1_PIPKU|nr:hypothetical protein mPipKuh1_009994 [Pipistrellus kuhlii]